MKTFKYLIPLLAAVFMGCETNTIEMDIDESYLYDNVWGVNPEAALDSTPELTYYDLNTGNVCMVNMSRRRVDVLLNEQECMASVEFDEEGLVKTVLLDSLTVCLSNYNADKVDVVFAYGDDMCIEKECELGVDNAELRIAAMSRNEYSATRGITDIAVYFDDYLRAHQDDINEIFEKTDKAMEWVGYIMNARVFGKLKVSESFIRDVVDPIDMMMDKQLEIIKEKNSEHQKSMENFMTAKDAYGLVGELSIGDGRYTNVKQLRKFKRFNIWYDAFKLLLTNYTDYSNYCEKLWSDFFAWRERVHRENEELAAGALNSGYGDLKATLSWNFYADIDLHAVEPSGFHIYYNNKVSPYSNGFLDVDNIHGGPGAVENIYWEEPADGTYNIYINYYGPYEGPSGSCRVALFYKGQSIGVHTVNMNYESGEQPIQTVSVSGGAAEASPVRANFVINYVNTPKK